MGGRWVHLPLPPKAWFIYDAAGLAAGALPENLRENPDTTGWAYKADTIEELAALIDVPADELSKTVSTWNTFCDNGEDLAFYRPSNHMTKVAEGPFYATLCTPTMLNTDGGPVRDAEARILDPYGNPDRESVLRWRVRFYLGQHVPGYGQHWRVRRIRPHRCPQRYGEIVFATPLT